jgi:hypothetical protein
MCLIFVDLTRCVMILQMTPNVPSFKSHYDDDDLEDLLCVRPVIGFDKWIGAGERSEARLSFLSQSLLFQPPFS